MRHDLRMIEVGLKYILKYQPSNFIEIGSRDGHDTATIAQTFNIPSDHCHIFEAHPDCYNAIKKQYPYFNVHNCAISDQTKPIEFNAGIVGVEDNIGCSSIHDDVSKTFRSRKVVIDAWRFDEVSTQLGLDDIDIIKIDVEGHTYEVLEGFGSTIQTVKVLQLELEHKESWAGQKLYDDIASYLFSKNFQQIYYVKHSHDQSDSLWVNTKHFTV
jgi:FkbM family methyltransferase